MSDKAADLSEFEAQMRRNGPMCSIATIREQLTADQKRNLDAAFGSEAIYASVIARVLGNWGHRVKADTVNRHRRGECACSR